MLRAGTKTFRQKTIAGILMVTLSGAYCLLCCGEIIAAVKAAHHSASQSVEAENCRSSKTGRGEKSAEGKKCCCCQGGACPMKKNAEKLTAGVDLTNVAVVFRRKLPKSRREITRGQNSSYSIFPFPENRGKRQSFMTAFFVGAQQKFLQRTFRLKVCSALN